MNVDQYRHEAAGLSPAAQFVHHFMTSANPFLERTSEWAWHAKRNFLNPDLLDQLFVKERNFLSECSGAELSILKNAGARNFYSKFSALEPTRI